MAWLPGALRSLALKYPHLKTRYCVLDGYPKAIIRIVAYSAACGVNDDNVLGMAEMSRIPLCGAKGAKYLYAIQPRNADPRIHVPLLYSVLLDRVSALPPFFRAKTNTRHVDLSGEASSPSSPSPSLSATRELVELIEGGSVDAEPEVCIRAGKVLAPRLEAKG